MSSIVTLTIVLLVLAAICLIIIMLHNSVNKKHTSSLLNRFKKALLENNITVSVTEVLKNIIVGIDYDKNKMMVLQQQEANIIDLAELKLCRKQKKWLHIPAGKETGRPETHLEKIVLELQFTGYRPAVELIFYEYRYNSLFQMHELEQKADYWELLITQQIKSR